MEVILHLTHSTATNMGLRSDYIVLIHQLLFPLQNVELVSMDTTSSPGRWLVQLRRAAQTCDPQDLPITLEIPNFVVWAQGGKYPFPSKHAQAGNSQVAFGGSQQGGAYAPPSALELAASRSLRFTMPQYRVHSDAVTQYMCSNFEVPVDKKYQIIQYKVKIWTSLNSEFCIALGTLH